MRCPSCNATNPDTATFCGQCYEKFSAPEPEPGALPTREVDPSASVDPAPLATPVPDWLVLSDSADLPLAQPADDTAGEERDAPAGSGSAVIGRFRAEDGSLGWTCGVCGEANPLEEFTCSVCGSRMDAEEPDEGPKVAWETARRIEMLAPGIGHIQAGVTGMGIARTGMVVFWAIGALALSGGGASGLVTAVPFLLGIAAVWITGPGDLEAARMGRPPRLDARKFMYLVIGVLVGVIVLGGIGVAL